MELKYFKSPYDVDDGNYEMLLDCEKFLIEYYGERLVSWDYFYEQELVDDCPEPTVDFDIFEVRYDLSEDGYSFQEAFVERVAGKFYISSRLDAGDKIADYIKLMDEITKCKELKIQWLHGPHLEGFVVKRGKQWLMLHFWPVAGVWTVTLDVALIIKDINDLSAAFERKYKTA